MRIREKLLDFKRRLSDRKMYSVTILVIGLVGIWGFYEYKQASNYRQELDNQYNRAFVDMVDYVENVETHLMKALITSTPNKTAAMLQEAWREANLAQTNLGQLPVSQPVLANTSKFLTQVGDLAYVLNNQNTSGKSLSDQQYQTLEQLHGYAVSLGTSLNNLQNSIMTGRIRWGELAKKGTPLFSKTSAEMPAKQFENVDKAFQKYPVLIYDGPFSDHMESAQPVGITGNDLNSEQAKQSVLKFFGQDKVNKITDTGKVDNGSIKTYTYSVTFKGAPEEQNANIAVTQKGGHVVWMLRNKAVPKETLNIDQAKEAGRKFLEKLGYTNMTDTYYLKEDNTATINYAYKQGDVVVYPDLIKVKIALDNGEVVGYESKGYLFSHKERSIPTPKISMEEARKVVNNRMQILSTGFAIIPTEYKSEIFTYEFKGKLNDRDFLVYVNAETGNEENILMIIETPNGILTM